MGSKGLKWQCQIREQQNTFQHTSCQITGTHSCKTLSPAALMLFTKPSKNTYKNSSRVKPQLPGSWILFRACASPDVSVFTTSSSFQNSAIICSRMNEAPITPINPNKSIGGTSKEKRNHIHCRILLFLGQRHRMEDCTQILSEKLE